MLLLEQPATAQRPTPAKQDHGRSELKRRAGIGARGWRPALPVWQAARLFDRGAALARRSIGVAARALTGRAGAARLFFFGQVAQERALGRALGVADHVAGAREARFGRRDGRI